MLLGGFARRAVSSIKTDYDHGKHRQQRHDVSQGNGLRERGTTAIVPHGAAAFWTDGEVLGGDHAIASGGIAGLFGTGLKMKN